MKMCHVTRVREVELGLLITTLHLSGNFCHFANRRMANTNIEFKLANLKFRLVTFTIAKIEELPSAALNILSAQNLIYHTSGW